MLESASLAPPGAPAPGDGRPSGPSSLPGVDPRQTADVGGAYPRHPGQYRTVNP